MCLASDLFKGDAGGTIWHGLAWFGTIWHRGPGAHARMPASNGRHRVTAPGEPTAAVEGY